MPRLELSHYVRGGLIAEDMTWCTVDVLWICGRSWSSPSGPIGCALSAPGVVVKGHHLKIIERLVLHIRRRSVLVGPEQQRDRPPPAEQLGSGTCYSLPGLAAASS